jgi:hypothetical protein
MLYVYGIVDSDRFETIRGEGHEAADVVPVPCDAFAAAVSVLSAGAIAATPQSVWRHERVLERLMQDHAVLPLRFGMLCRDEEALREQLPGSTDGYRNDLERVRGRVEIALRIVDRVPILQTVEAVIGGLEAANDLKPAGRGTSYLRARLQRLHGDMSREDSGKRMEQMLREQLGTLLKDVICTPPANASAGYPVSCLVDRAQVAAFTGVLDRFRGDHPQFDVTRTGPWAPYSFVAAQPVSRRAS